MTNQTSRKSTYPPEFRAEAIQLARTSGKPQTVIARELGMSVETLRLWLKHGRERLSAVAAGHERGDLAPVAQASRSRCGQAQRWADERGAGGTAALAAREPHLARGA